MLGRLVYWRGEGTGRREGRGKKERVRGGGRGLSLVNCAVMWLLLNASQCLRFHLFPVQREIENSYASNADYVHKSVLFTDEGRKRYAEQVRNDLASTLVV